MNFLPLPSEQTHLTHPRYRADIDGLRAIAILSVVGFHAFPLWLRGGFIGVDIFFVISGFLISTIIFDSLERNRFSFVEFYSKRIKRIFPALLSVLIPSFALGWFVLLADEYKQLGEHIAGGAGFVSNYILWNESGYFDNSAETKPLLHLWSLAIEEQFYIVWPLLLAFVWKRKWSFVTITATVALLSFAANIYLIGNPPSSFYLPITRFWELMIGGLLAYIALHKPKLNNQYKNTQSVLGVALLIIGLLLLNKDRAFPGWWAILPTLGAFFLISAGQDTLLNKHVLSNKVLVWFGLISYPLYLWHWPILSFTSILQTHFPSRAVRIVLVVISIVLAWLTYRLIEKPIRFGKYGNAKAIILIGLMLAVGCAGYTTYKFDGFSFRVNKLIELSKYDSVIPNQPSHYEGCDSLYPQFKEFSKCSISHQNDPGIAIIGDSHSNRYYLSLKNLLPESTVMQIANYGCLPFSSKSLQATKQCNERFNLALDFLKNTESIKTVYLTGYWSYLAAGSFVDRDNWRYAEPLTNEETISFQNNGEYFLSSLTSANKNVILILDAPSLNFNIKSCLYELPHRLTKLKPGAPCAMDKPEFERFNSAYDSVMLGILSKFPTIRIFDPKPYFCDQKLCWGIRENKLLYDDGDHISAFASDQIVKDLLSKFPIN